MPHVSGVGTKWFINLDFPSDFEDRWTFSYFLLFYSQDWIGKGINSNIEATAKAREGRRQEDHALNIFILMCVALGSVTHGYTASIIGITLGKHSLSHY
jgi:hypothetical protein